MLHRDDKTKNSRKVKEHNRDLKNNKQTKAVARANMAMPKKNELNRNGKTFKL